MKASKLLNLSVIICLVLLTGAATGVYGGEYEHEVKAKKISFSWTVAGDTLAVKISAPTKGWVGVGFNPSKKMKDANFILGYVKKGEAKIIDEFGSANTKHSSDKKLGGTPDATLVGGKEEGGVTVIEFTIPLNSADKYDSSVDVNGETVVLLAYGPDRDSFKTKHKYRTALKINLGSGSSEPLKK
ncbi:MAG: DOMON domain-containing protein [Deltaproteobacteria bacterium]|nr:DOMON domain-containing protein [Deltaproteobacteria bacterium]MBW2658607.1 DOMON domain-containing protein [Deltaproteobacteria bacterium]